MNLDYLALEDGKFLKDSVSHKDALAYLNAKFAPLTEEQVKAWLATHGTVLSDKQFKGVVHDVLVKNPPLVNPDPMLIWYIEEILEIMAKLWGIKSSTYTG